MLYLFFNKETHSAAWRNMIAGGATYRYRALKSPGAYTCGRKKKVQPAGSAGTIGNWRALPLYLIDSPKT